MGVGAAEAASRSGRTATTARMSASGAKGESGIEQHELPVPACARHLVVRAKPQTIGLADPLGPALPTGGDGELPAVERTGRRGDSLLADHPERHWIEGVHRHDRPAEDRQATAPGARERHTDEGERRDAVGQEWAKLRW